MPHTEAQKRASRIARGLPPNKRSSGHAKRSSGHAKRSSGHSRASIAAKLKTGKARFVAWDGEGVTDVDGSHRYTLFANSRREYIEAHSLSTEACLDFLLANAKPGDVNVIFGGSYDISMWLRDLSRNDIARIVDNETELSVRVVIGRKEYAIHYRPRKSIKIGLVNSAEPWRMRGGKWQVNYSARITVWDAFGFFQTSFVKACESYGVSVWSEMQKFKNSRSTFSDDSALEIREYCFQECEQLARLMEVLQGYLHEAGLYPKRWDGAGAVAAALLHREGVKAHIVPEPTYLIIPVASAFFGGRIEVCKVGRAKRAVYNYDIASAYPAAAQDLPTLHGRWISDKYPRDAQSFTLSFVEWDFPDGEPWYPLPFRDARDGTIVFGNKGRGWFWQPEFLAAREWAKLRGYGDGIRRGKTFTFIPDSGVKPFGFIPHLSAKRQEYKRAGNGAEKALKLALNSLYGKTAQQVGAREGKPPPYFSLPWAGWITSATRARLVRAAMTDPSAIVAFATDGLYTTRPLPMETAKGELGAWEPPTRSEDAVFVAAGVYWTKENGEWKARYRGFDKAGMMTPDGVLAAWRVGATSMGIPSTRFVTHKGALRSKILWNAVCTWRTINRTLDLSGKSPKRSGVVSTRKGEHAMHLRLVPLPPRTFLAYEERQGESAPYETFRLAEVDGTDEVIYEQEWEESNV